VVEMHDVDAFERAVSTYPAVTVIRRTAQEKAVVATANRTFGPEGAGELVRWVSSGQEGTVEGSSFSAVRLSEWHGGPDLWPSGDPRAIALVRLLEDRFPPLEDPATGTRVGIGVTTGADEVYVTRDAGLVEPDRLLPLVTAEDVRCGQVQWSGTYLVNPWGERGLVDLRSYPRLKDYYERHRRTLERRHVAKANPHAWYRTIDSVRFDLVGVRKLLVPHIQTSLSPALDDGGLYPHKSLYVITSRDWDLEVLGGLLLSELADLFVGTYCTKMRGGCYQVQAQYLRNVRVPVIGSVGASERRSAGRSGTPSVTGTERRPLLSPWGCSASRLFPPLSPSGRGVPEQQTAVARETGRGRSGSGRWLSRVKQVGGEAGPAEGCRA